MIVDLEASKKKTEEEVGSFDLEGGGKLHLRLPPVEEIVAIRERHVHKSVEYPFIGGQYRHVDTKTFDDQGWWADTLDATITGWDDCFDKNGQPIPCTKEMKVKLFECSIAFINAYTAGMDMLRKARQARAESSEKNLPTGQIG